MPQLLSSGGVLVAAIVLAVLARRLGRPDDVAMSLVIAAVLGALIWMPETPRSIVIGAVVVLFGAMFGPWGLVVTAAGALAVGVLVPGGVSVLVLGVIVLFGVSEVRRTRRHLVRIARATSLVANEQVAAEVELTGRARATRPLRDPVHGQPCAMWAVSTAAARKDSEVLVEIRGDTGSAIVDPASVRMDWQGQSETLDGERAREVARAVGLELDAAGVVFLHVLPEGAECYVVGWPTWELAPPGTSATYRDAPVLPTFRATPERPAWFADRGEAQLRRDLVWAQLAWTTWTVVCAGIAIAQSGGG